MRRHDASQHAHGAEEDSVRCFLRLSKAMLDACLKDSMSLGSLALLRISFPAENEASTRACFSLFSGWAC